MEYRYIYIFDIGIALIKFVILLNVFFVVLFLFLILYTYLDSRRVGRIFVPWSSGSRVQSEKVAFSDQHSLNSIR